MQTLELKEYLSLDKNFNRENFVKDFTDYLTTQELKLEQIPLLLKLIRMYKTFFRDKGNNLINIIGQRKDSDITIELLDLFIRYEMNLDRNLIKEKLTKTFARFVYKMPEKIDNLFKDEVNAHQFTGNLSSDIFHVVIKWYRNLQTNEEFFVCDACESYLVPFFEKMDNYICSNDGCENSKNVHYHNHCWSCQSTIDSEYNAECLTCNWYICNSCGSCMQDNKCKNQKAASKILRKSIEIKNLVDDDFLDQIYKSAIKKIKKKVEGKVNISNINRGIKIIEKEEDLDYYLAAYTRHHSAKINQAFEKIKINNDRKICVYDWGCGQGIGTLLFIEKLKKENKLNLLKEIRLVEPSNIALVRANKFIKNLLTNKITEIKILNEIKELSLIDSKIFNSVSEYDVYHIFSNILDVQFDMKALIKGLQKMNAIRKVFICVSPNYRAAKLRINDFHENFIKEQGYILINNDNTSIKTMMYDILKNKYTKRLVKRYEVTFEILK